MTEPTSISISPVQKIGADWPSAARPTARRSSTVPRRAAARMPSGRATASASTSALAARSIEAGRRSTTRPIAGC